MKLCGPKKKLKKVLIANRSEIALRIQHSCHVAGITTVAIYAPEDRDSRFVSSAHEAYGLSLSGSAAYLNQDEIIGIALRCQADGIHPGYGFLSENWLFAQRVIDAGLVWIGPSPESIRSMGDKNNARDLMEKAGVPIIPGQLVDHAYDQSIEYVAKVAQQVGYPLILKDPMSGGGKAMRQVLSPQDLESSWLMVCSESKKMTGSNQMLIERLIQSGRHVEIQVVGDGTTCIHLYERECSIQRRHQKIIEETPCTFLSSATLASMYDAALKAARAVCFVSIGTVEFIVTPDEHFYFLEMNTRLQVEHSITELTTGIDLVALQLYIAQQGALPLAQEQIFRTGHAIECRIYAEDPENNFMPSTGTLYRFFVPHAPFMRIDHDLVQGKDVTPFFDPMIAKISAFGADRDHAKNNMLAVLQKTEIAGIKTNILFLQTILKSDAFAQGAFHTQWLSDKSVVAALLSVQDIKDQKIALIAALLLEQLGGSFSQKEQVRVGADSLDLWGVQQWR